jgi:cell division protein FtsW
MATTPAIDDAYESTVSDDRPAVLFDPVVLFIAGTLMTLGVAMVYSASVTVAGAELDLHQWWKTPLRQSVFAILGFLVMLIAAHCDYRWLAWQRPRTFWRVGFLFVLAAVLLVAVLFIGTEVLGAQRAIVVLRSPLRLSFQPSELAKVVLVIWLAALLARMQQPHLDSRSRRFGRPPGARELPMVRTLLRGFVPLMLTAGLLIALTGLEDFGTAALMGVITMALLVTAGARWLHMFGAGGLGLLGGAALILHKTYRLERIKTFLFKTPDPLGDGYQADQSLLAIGSGGWFGRGLGASIQKYGYLPQKDNDFILATICEELGVVGGIVVVLLFLLLLWRGWRLARNADDYFGRFLATGITLMFCLQAAFNIGVVTNSVPTKGISLPFVSAGGSGVVFLGLAAGILASVGRTRAAPPEYRAG